MIMKKKERRDWSEFPVDLLVEILGHLALLDHLSFRGVCKAWRSASLKCPPENQPTVQPQWLMFSTKSSSAWKFLDSSTRRLYFMDLPQLAGNRAKILLSKHGWLLLAHIRPFSIFFFNPFSRAQIDLPWNPAFELLFYSGTGGKKPAIAVSAPPTSRDCAVFAVAYVDPDTFQISACRRGEDAWTSQTFTSKIGEFFPIISAVFCAGMLYWVDKPGIVRTFSVENGAWARLRRPRKYSKVGIFENYYSYLMECDGQVMMCLRLPMSGRRHYVELEVPEGEGDDGMAKTVVLGRDDHRYLVEYYKNAGLRPEIFSVGEWCVSCDSEDDHGHKLFSWHLWHDTYWERKCDSENSVWIEPKWINPSPTIAWTA